jgi:hypothetical protein
MCSIIYNILKRNSKVLYSYLVILNNCDVYFCVNPVVIDRTSWLKFLLVFGRPRVQISAPAIVSAN